MKQYQSIILWGVLTGAMMASAQASVCKLSEPSNTPVNVRNSPNGTILGQLDNGTVVQVRSNDNGNDGKGWAYIAWQGQPLKNAKTARFEGWVPQEHISCR